MAWLGVDTLICKVPPCSLAHSILQFHFPAGLTLKLTVPSEQLLSQVVISYPKHLSGPVVMQEWASYANTQLLTLMPRQGGVQPWG